MPRGKPVPRSIVPKEAPRLWNARRRIKTSIPARLEHEVPSDDVVEFIDKAKRLYRPLLPHQLHSCWYNPAQFFSRPHNVHPRLRKQVYLPNVKVALRRTPYLPPKYAQFDVPLWFNKLDIKDFLKSVYNVDIIHARSSITNGRVQRRRTTNPRSTAPLYRETSKKKMTVQLVEPFIWPEEITDLTPWENDRFWTERKAQLDQQRMDSDWTRINPSEKHRKSIAEQAKELLSGKATWSPTWQHVPVDVRAMTGKNDRPS